MPEKIISIGSGPAGLTAAIYAARANLRPLVFDGFQAGGMPGGQLMTTDVIENFPGFPKGISGPDLMAGMREQAERFETRFVAEDVEKVRLGERPFQVISAGSQAYETHALIVATGATAQRLPLESEKRLWQKGISACAVCDGGLPVFRNKVLAVIGGGDTACEEALHLTQFASKVIMIHRRDQLRASKIMQERVMKHPKIQILWNRVVEEFSGQDFLAALRLKDTKTGATSEVNASGAFEAIGHRVNTGFLKGQLRTDANGYLVTMPGSMATSVEGVFAAGDVQDPHYRQAVTAAGCGCRAALDAERWLQEKGL
jgi:thioredoxin reductase (NADPH)